MTIKLHFTGGEVEEVVDTGASASVVEKCLVFKLEIWKKARKVKVRQGDGSSLGENFVANTMFKVMDSASVLGKFGMDAKVLDFGNIDMILVLYWLTENGFSVDSQYGA